MSNIKIFFLLMILVILSSCGNDRFSHTDHERNMKNDEKKVFTCPMHPQIIRDKPGQCPICGMDLVEKSGKGENISDTNLTFLLKPTDEYVLSNINTISLTEKELPLNLEATGLIEYDSRLENTVSAKISGRIEKLYVKYKYQSVSRGQKLMDIYSNDLLTEQENFLYLLKNDPENKSMADAARSKLKLMGISGEQIGQIEKTKKTISSITLFSPYSGHLHDVSAITAGNNEMDKGQAASQELLLKEGMYIKKGQTVFNIYDLQNVWAVLNIYPEAQSAIKKGQKIMLYTNAPGNDSIESIINFIEPVLRTEQRTATIRVYLKNESGALKPGTIVKANITTDKRKRNYLPAHAVLNLGINNVVFIRENSSFRAVQVKLGIISGEWIEIISGLNNIEPVAENAHQLMDSESFVKLKRK